MSSANPPGGRDDSPAAVAWQPPAADPEPAAATGVSPAPPTSQAPPREPEVDTGEHDSVASQEAPPASPAESAELLSVTRISAMWVAVVVFAVVLVLILIFVLQNMNKVQVSYFSAHGQLPLSVAMLFSGVAGVVLAAIAGTLRIIQLRRRVRRVTNS